MEETPQGPLEGLRKHWWTAFAGLSVFIGAGLIFAPGLIRHESAAVPDLSSRSPAHEPEAKGDTESALATIFGSSPDPANTTDADREFDCMVSANEVVDIGSAITGLIGSIYVERGEYVYAGQTIALLESTVERAAVRVARALSEREVDVKASRANLKLTKTRESRADALFDADSISKDVREQAETEAVLAGIELERAKENNRLASLELDHAKAVLRRRVITSPVSGLVVERLMAPGEVVEKETILRIAEIDTLRVEVILPSRLFGQVKVGDTAEIIPEPPYDQAREAEVKIVDRIIDGASGTFGVRLLVPNPEHDLPGGLRCSVRFAPSAPPAPGVAGAQDDL